MTRPSPPLKAITPALILPNMVMLALSLIALFPFPSSAWIMTHPQGLLFTPTTTTTRLKYNNDDDFASLSNSEAEEEGLRLAREFNNELQLRRRGRSDIQPLYEYDDNDDDDNNGSSKSADEATSSSWIRRTSSSRTFVNTNNQSSSSSSSPRESSLEALFSFLSSFDSSRRTTSAGLFSGSGISVYSPGRSLRTEIELLETIMKNNDAATATEISKTNNDSSINNNDTVRNGMYIGTLSLIILSAVSSGVGMDMIMTSDYSPVASIEDAFASLNHLVTIIDDVTREGISSVMIIANNGEVFMDEEAHWLMRESSELAATICNTMQSSMEQLVMK